MNALLYATVAEQPPFLDEDRDSTGQFQAFIDDDGFGPDNNLRDVALQVEQAESLEAQRMKTERHFARMNGVVCAVGEMALLTHRVTPEASLQESETPRRWQGLGALTVAITGEGLIATEERTSRIEPTFAEVCLDGISVNLPLSATPVLNFLPQS